MTIPRAAQMAGATLLLLLLSMGATAVDMPNPAYRAWVDDMKRAERGPFVAVRWYCKDGTSFPPADYACASHGGGQQYGEWGPRTKELRSKGYKIGNVLAGMDVGKVATAPDSVDTVTQLLIERFLVADDDGWIFRRARYYRGAIQEEDERKAARALLIALAAQPEWITLRYAVLFTAARMLPHGRDEASMQKVRQMAATLADRDAAFQRLRAGIHNAPEAADAKRVRDYAATVKDTARRPEYEALAAAIDQVYAPRPLAAMIDATRTSWQRSEPALGVALADASKAWSTAGDDVARYATSAQLLATLRAIAPSLKGGAPRLAALDLALATEVENFRLSTVLRESATRLSRRASAELLALDVQAAYGAGVLDDRQALELAKTFATLRVDDIDVASYLRTLRYLALVPGWGTQNLRFDFALPVAKLAEIEPRADLFVQDLVRGSPLLFYSQLLDTLTRDANRVAGVQHKVFGVEIGVGFNALNPGLARGTLVTAPDMQRLDSFRASSIYVLPETVAELTPVGGILTTGAGNPLSHVQLLARNLGIPNVAIDESVLGTLRSRDGKSVVLAVSPSGIVEIADDAPAWDKVFGTQHTSTSDVMFDADLSKLDLTKRDFVSLDQLRAADSGRIVGPKAAKVGELRAHFPDNVVRGVGIPFGLYREVVLDRPYKNTGMTFFQWMVGQFRALEAIPAGSPEAAKASEALRAEIYSTILNTDVGPQFRERLRKAMAQEFGANWKGGVFVRSDTNVEDLPGFTGAGLNLTLPNVVGFDNVVKALSAVWASPYTPRAWAWRQAHMRGPENVYPAVLLMQTVPSAKSGVMITQDVDTGDRNVLSVAVNEGVSGAVDGQAAESLRINMTTGDVRLMAVATAPTRLVPLASGGVATLPATGAQTLMQPGEIKALSKFARAIPTQFPQHDVNGAPAAADVEFAFVDGKLWLLQIRPFNESKQAQANSYLVGMDRGLAGLAQRRINLTEVPR